MSNESQENINEAEPNPDYPEFDYELTALWENCRLFVESLRDGRARIEPLHLALVLLFDGMSDCEDPRLRGFITKPTLEKPWPLERSLFWTAISRVCKPDMPNTLCEHIQSTVYNDNDNGTPQMALGISLWNKAQEMPPSGKPKAAIDENNVLSLCSESARLVCEKAEATRKDAGDKFLFSHHILLALLEDEHVKGVIEQEKLSVEAIAQTVKALRSQAVTERGPHTSFPLLNRYGEDLTKLAQTGKIGPIIGRNCEVRRLISILSRRSKNNAVLLGDSGVGKTAIAESLAVRIINGEIPEAVTARVFSLDLGALLASTACKSLYEEIIGEILEEIAMHEKKGIDVILFIDDLTQITIGGYRDSGVGLDAASLIKPYLATGKFRCVGCSTFEGYKSIEKDGALARHFTPIYVCEPTVQETTGILRGLREGLQQFHGVRILDDALVSAASLAAQYFTDRRLPDAAIDLVDEACASVRIGTGSTWDQLGQLKRRKIAIELDIRSLEREVDDESAKRLKTSMDALSDVQKQMDNLANTKRGTRATRTKIDELNRRIQELKEQPEKAGALAGNRKLELIKLEREKFALSSTANDIGGLENKIVSKRDVAQVASFHVFIPAIATEQKNAGILNVSEILAKKVVAQPEAVNALSGAVRCMMTGLTDPLKPIASLLFGGRSGTGKALLTRELTSFLPRTSGKFIRINGSDYAEAHSIVKLVGTPTCMGLDHGGQLTECVRRSPFSVVYVHEVEQACIEFRQTLQTILDEGFLKNGDGKNVDFRNCIIIMTTSIGQRTLQHTFTEKEERNHFQKEIQRFLGNEFLARLDDLIIFNRVGEETMGLVIDARLEEIKEQLSRVNLYLEVNDSAKRYIKQHGWSHVSGIRDFETLIRSEVIRPLAGLLLDGSVSDNSRVIISYNEDADAIDVSPGGPIPALTHHITATSNDYLSFSSSSAGRGFLASDLIGGGLETASSGRERDSPEDTPSRSRPKPQVCPQRLF